MKKFGVLLCVMLCVPMFAFKANNEEQIILTVQYERPDKRTWWFTSNICSSSLPRPK